MIHFLFLLAARKMTGCELVGHPLLAEKVSSTSNSGFDRERADRLVVGLHRPVRGGFACFASLIRFTRSQSRVWKRSYAFCAVASKGCRVAGRVPAAGTIGMTWPASFVLWKGAGCSDGLPLGLQFFACALAGRLCAGGRFFRLAAARARSLCGGHDIRFRERRWLEIPRNGGWMSTVLRGQQGAEGRLRGEHRSARGPRATLCGRCAQAGGRMKEQGRRGIRTVVKLEPGRFEQKNHLYRKQITYRRLARFVHESWR